MLVDRGEEQRELEGLLGQPGPRLAVLYGRRRIGKTYLLTHTWPEADRFYFLASESTPELNRKELVLELARWTGESLDPADYPTWRAVFRLLLSLRSPRPTAVVLDEFQYLLGGAEDVLSQLVAVWDVHRDRRPYVLALSGSAVRVMESIDASGSALYGRLHWKGQLRPFDYWHAGLMAPFSDLRERARAYAVFGGTPQFLTAIDPAAPLAESAARAVLSPRGQVRHLVETAIDQERGLRNTAVYKAVLTAIARGRTELNAIAQLTELAAETPLRVVIRRLVELGYVEAHRNFAARRKEAYRYRLADPALVFHYDVVERLRGELETTDPLEVWQTRVAPALDGYTGRTFERITRQGVYRLRKHLHLPAIAEWGRWEGKTRDRESVEIDVVARLREGRLLTGSVKWNAQPVEPGVHRSHVRNLESLARSGHRWAHEALEPESPLLYVAAGGFREDFRRAAELEGHRVLLLSLEDLYSARAAGEHNFG